jgi:2'-5' RNA ligase
MREHIRTFIAIKVVPHQLLLEQIGALKTAFKNERIRWVEPDDFHLTIRFVGNTTREQLYYLVDELATLEKTMGSFNLEIKGAGYFTSKDKPRVLFANVSESERLIQLVQKVESVVVAAGFHPELKEFKPHVTLARIKRLEQTSSFFETMKRVSNQTFQHVVVRDFVLFQSILKPEGPIYKTIKTFNLS